MGLIDDLRSEVQGDVAAEMAVIVEERLNARLAEKRESLHTQLNSLREETTRVENEIAELTPAVAEVIAEEVAEEVTETPTEEPQG